MMGLEVRDPDHVEGDIERLPGLGLLPTTTTMSGEKVTRQTTFCRPSYYEGTGYEIHMGTTLPLGDARPSPFATLGDGRDDGYCVSEKCMGTYLHGVLDNASFVDYLLRPFSGKLDEAGKPFDYAAFKEEQYNRLADHVRRYVDMERVYKILTND
jgi:adenosylcobyric acid synthase